MNSFDLALVLLYLFLITLLTRYLPLVFSHHLVQVPMIRRIEKTLPPGIITIVALYALVEIPSLPLVEASTKLAGMGGVAVLQLVWRNMFISLFGGFFLYQAAFYLINYFEKYAI